MKYFSTIQKNTELGFTLVELLVAIAVFVTLATFSLGSVLGILDAGRKAKSLNSVMTNLNFTMEVMSREIRFGNSYHCGDASPFTLSNPPSAQDCTGNIVAASNAFSFLTNNGLPTVYKLDTVKKQILKSSDGGTTFVGVTAPEVVIQDLKFYVFNSTPQSDPSPDNAQPKVIVLIRGYAGTKPTTQSSFVLQATLSQRPLDRSVTPTSAPVYDPFTYTFCANENGTCNFSGTATVAYGASGLYNYQTGVANTIACTNAVFGDPIVGTAKACYYKLDVSSPLDTVWFDDSLPAGASPAGDGGDTWTWVSSSPTPFSGTSAHQSNIAAGEHQHYFTGASSPLAVSVGDKMVAYVYLDPSNPPTEIMLQWNVGGSWEHRAYWGANTIPWGSDGTISRQSMGALPTTGQWVRLEVPASSVGLEGTSVNGMAFTISDGRATWDHAGKNP